jgi:16S rRNA (adenine1518-N6/adenine1519-N6)-dimethyltransferase
MTLPPLDVPGLLRQAGLNPKKKLGQNFLMDSAALQRVVAAGDVASQDEVLEIGAGLGSLTRHLSQAARQVVAVELDLQLVPILQQVLAGLTNVQIVPGDVLELDPAQLMSSDQYLVVANIPYYITSAIIRHLLAAPKRPLRLVLTIQREVAERICARPGDLSLLALSVQVYGSPRIAARIPAGAFYPAPDVDSSVLRVDLYSEPQIPPDQLAAFFTLARMGFSQKRKTLRNTLAAGLGCKGEVAAEMLHAAGIDPQRRAETLNLDEWRQLTRTIGPQLAQPVQPARPKRPHKPVAPHPS